MATESTAVAKRDAKKDTPALSPEREAKIAEARERMSVAKAIRGTLWGKDVAPLVMDALILYCRQNRLDAVRHVEVLGGNIYLNATFYRERGAPLLHSGEVVFEDPDYINADPRLDEDAKAGDKWAIEENARRRRERIKYAVPEAAKAAVVQRARLRSGMVAVGINWIGGSNKPDPVGQAEPAKTAQTRAERRCWMRIADFAPSYAAIVRPVEESAKGALPVAVVEAATMQQQITAGAPIDTGQDENYAAHGGVAEEPARPTREPGEEEELDLNDRRPRD